MGVDIVYRLVFVCMLRYEMSLIYADCRKMLCWKLDGRELGMRRLCIVIRMLTFLVFAEFSCPCLTCSVKIVQIGVKEVVYNVSYSMDTQAEEVMRAGGVKVRQYSPPQEGLIW